MKTIHWLQHVPFEGLGAIKLWADIHHVECIPVKLYENDPLPDPSDVDMAVIMGGPMGVSDTALYPWLEEEICWVGTLIQQNKKILGICLGAQIIAHAMGAEITQNAHKEIGWFPVVSASGINTFLSDLFIDAPEVFHWHGETFGIPEGATLIAASDGCDNQGFVVGDRIAGLQFHLETTPDSAKALIKACHDDMTPGLYVQNAEAIFSDSSRFEAANQLLFKLMERFKTDYE